MGFWSYITKAFKSNPKPKGLPQPDDYLHPDAMPAGLQEVEAEEQARFQKSLRKITYLGLAEDHKSSFYAWVFRSKKELTYYQEMWAMRVETFNQALDVLYHPLYSRREHLVKLKQQITDFHREFKQEHEGIKGAFHEAESFGDLRDVISKLTVNEKKRKELEALCEHYNKLFDKKEAFNSLHAEYDGNFTPQLRHDPAIEKYSLSYVDTQDENSFGYHFAEHSNASIWRLHHDLVEVIEAILADMKRINRFEKPNIAVRNVWGLRSIADDDTQMYRIKREILRERRDCLAHHKFIAYSMMYERLNQFLTNLPDYEEQSLFDRFYVAVDDYLKKQLQQYPDINDVIEEHQPEINSLAVRHYAESLENNYRDILMNYNALAGKKITDFAIIKAGKKINLALGEESEEFRYAVDTYIASCQKAIADADFIAQLEGKTFAECNQLITQECLRVYEAMEAAPDYGPVIVQKLMSYIDEFLKTGQQYYAEKLFAEVVEDNGWLARSERDFYFNQAVGVKLRQLQQREQADLFEFKTKFDYRFSKQRLLLDMGRLFNNEKANRHLHQRITHYLATLEKIDQYQQVLDERERSALDLLQRLMAGALTQADLNQPIVNKDGLLVGFQCFNDLDAVFQGADPQKMGMGFHKHLIQRYVKLILDNELEQTLEGIQNKQVEAEQLLRMQTYFRLYRTYFPDDKEFVGKYVNKAKRAKEFFHNVLSAVNGAEVDISDDSVQDNILFNFQYINVLDNLSKDLYVYMGNYLHQFAGGNVTYFPLFFALNTPYIDPTSGDNIEPLNCYMTQVFVYLFQQGGIAHLDFSTPENDAFLQVLDLLLKDHPEDYPEIYQEFCRQITAYVNSVEGWDRQGQQFMVRYAEPLVLAQYNVQGFLHHLEQDQEHQTEAYIEQIRQAETYGHNFVITDEQHRQLELAVDTALLDLVFPDEEQAQGLLRVFSKGSMQKLVDVCVPSRQPKVRLERLDRLVDLCLRYGHENKSDDIFPVVREFINYFTQQKKHYDGIALDRENFLKAELIHMTAMEVDGCYMPDGEEALSSLDDFIRDATMKDRKQAYFAQLIKQRNEIFQQALEDKKVWSSNILWLMINFGSLQDIHQYFIQGLTYVLRKQDYSYAKAWKQSLIDIGLKNDVMKQLLQHWQGEIENCVRQYQAIHPCHISTLVVIEACDLDNDKHYYYRKRLEEMLTGEQGEFWQVNGYNELTIFERAFGVNPEVKDPELIQKRLNILFGTHQFDNVPQLVKSVEDYLATEMTNGVLNKLLGELGFIKYMPKNLQDVYVIKKGKEKDLHDFEFRLRINDFDGVKELYEKFQRDLKDSAGKHRAIQAACQKLLLDVETKLVEQVTNRAILNLILLHADDYDCYLVEKFDQHVREEVGGKIWDEKQKLAEQLVKEDYQQQREEIELAYLNSHYLALAEKTIIREKQKKGSTPSKKDLPELLRKKYKKKTDAKARRDAQIALRKSMLKKNKAYEKEFLMQPENIEKVEQLLAQKILIDLIHDRIEEFARQQFPGEEITCYEHGLELLLNAQKARDGNQFDSKKAKWGLFQQAYQSMNFINLDKNHSIAYQSPGLYDGVMEYLTFIAREKIEQTHPTTPEDFERRVNVQKIQICKEQSRAVFRANFNMKLIQSNTKEAKALKHVTQHENFPADKASLIDFWVNTMNIQKREDLAVPLKYQLHMSQKNYTEQYWHQQLALIKFHKLDNLFADITRQLELDVEAVPKPEHHPYLQKMSLDGINFKPVDKGFVRVQSLHRVATPPGKKSGVRLGPDSPLAKASVNRRGSLPCQPRSVGETNVKVEPPIF